MRSSFRSASVSARSHLAAPVVAWLFALTACAGSALIADEGGGGSASGGSTSGGATSGGATQGGAGNGGAATGGSSCGACIDIGCGPGEVTVPPQDPCGCPSCAASCEGVACPPIGCAPASIPFTPPGSCCATECRLDCSLVDCAMPSCPAGQVAQTLPGSCCPTCVDDPKACQAPADCVIARRAGACCACPEAVNQRALELDVCWRPLSSSADPPECTTKPCGDVVCAPCRAPGAATCSGNQCVISDLPL
jgi:hypothetical protein